MFDHGAGLTIYNGTSEKDLGTHFFQYKIDLFNIGRYLNTTSGSTDALIVKYEPVYQNYPYNMLEDDHWWAYGNRPAVALDYFGSNGGGPDDSPGIHELRRSKLNGFDYSGYAFDPVDKVFLNETMRLNSAESITLQRLSLEDRCNKKVNFDSSSFQAEQENTTSNKQDSAMFVKSGYGKIIFSYPILRTMLKERFQDVTIDNSLQSIHFGGNEISNITDYHYIYPRVKFHTSVKAIAIRHDRSKWVTRDDSATNAKPLLVGGKNINRYSTNWDGSFLKYDLNGIHSCKTESIFITNEKLIFRRVANRLIATLDTEQFYGLHTLVVMNLKSETKQNIRYFLGIFNSKLMT